MMWKTKTLDFNNCITHLQETERFDIIRYDDYDDFMNKNNIYFDDEFHKNNPKRDVLYRKINDFYFVANNDYFEKSTDFYFKLYSNVFALFNLKKITLKYHNNLCHICVTLECWGLGCIPIGTMEMRKIDLKC